MTDDLNLIPPDGSWGWVILFAYVVINIIIVPVIQNFGFLFKDTFELKGFSGASVTSIVGTYISVSSLQGIAIGPLTKRFGLRKTSLGGAIVFSIGIISLTFATTFTHFLISYGIVTALGSGALRLTASIALNLYFVKRRIKVMGAGIALRSFGSIIYPFIITTLLSSYGSANAVLLIAGGCLHTICACLLLRPVDWYMKPIPSDNLSSTVSDAEIHILVEENKNSKLDEVPEIQGNSSIVTRLLNYYDLSLLKNGQLSIITVGLMFSVFADLNFGYLCPLVLSDLNFGNNQIATFLSVSYISNLVMTFTAPFIGDYFKRSSKFMYGLSCFLIVVGRLALMTMSSTTIIMVSIYWGAVRGMKTVYCNVIIADNVPRKQLASAEGIQLAVNGIFCLVFGPALGAVKDLTGSYVNCIYILNILTLITCVLWSSEKIYSRCRKKNGFRRQNTQPLL